ncbi:hypothetical protein LPJ56_005237, partial [Coemansia sp. RSA 2599]
EPDDFEDTDDFGGFGETNSEATGDDFGDFGDFDDFEPMPAQTTRSSGTASESRPPPPQSVAMPAAEAKPETSNLDALLTKAAPLFDRSDVSIDDKAALLSQCLSQSLLDIGGPTTNGSADDLDPPSHVDSPDLATVSSSLLSSTRGSFPDEPRLLWNLVFSAITDKIPESTLSLLLTPRSELEAASGIAMQAQHADDDAAAEEPALLSIDRIRQLAAQDVLDNADLLALALRSLDALISAREQEVVKRKDAIDAYNQVIQTLVVQATKLH